MERYFEDRYDEDPLDVFRGIFWGLVFSLILLGSVVAGILCFVR